MNKKLTKRERKYLRYKELLIHCAMTGEEMPPNKVHGQTKRSWRTYPHKQETYDYRGGTKKKGGKTKYLRK